MMSERNLLDPQALAIMPKGETVSVLDHFCLN